MNEGRLVKIVPEWLEDNGYDGLRNELGGCTCLIADLFHCDKPDLFHCVAAKKEEMGVDHE